MEWLMIAGGLLIWVGLIAFVRWAMNKEERENIYDKNTPSAADDPIALANIADKLGGGSGPS
ncbi:MAG: hypothetical protein ACRDKT_14755 [Actinomycetota bacterium]